MIRLFIADVSGLDIDSAVKRVSEYRREKVLRLKSEESKRASLGAELLLYSALGEGFRYSIAPGGKPVSESAHFSLSHCGRYSVCAVADVCVGVDIEAPRRDILPLARRFFSASEYEEIAGSDAPEELFCAVWVRKEACIKCSGQGLSALTAVRTEDYFTQNLTYGGCHIAIASERDPGDVELIAVTL
ncbi:MAG: 4'-phosphopantetheinyl transferase superfamily protein [Oscillospiraceae bacterium]|nr:4'-phosphopantetheinyl transferase superfamily protein [Oscillospiraceae bacterium]